MGSYIFVLVLVVLQGFVSFSEAFDKCLLEDSRVLLCTDGYSTVGYCCNIQNGFYSQCCYYSQVWALWYFWFCIVFFLLTVAAVAACCKRCLGKSKSSESQVGNLDVGYTATPQGPYVQTSTNPNPAMPQPVPVVMDVPPSYQQIEAQGIQEQYKEISAFNTPPAGGSPPYPTGTNHSSSSSSSSSTHH